MLFEQVKNGVILFEGKNINEHPAFKRLLVLHVSTVCINNILERVYHRFDLSSRFVEIIYLVVSPVGIVNHGYSTKRMCLFKKFLNGVTLSATVYTSEIVLGFFRACGIVYKDRNASILAHLI